MSKYPFIVFSAQRAGSHLLSSALNFHPELDCIIHEPFVDRKIDVKRYLKEHVNEPTGFLVKYKQVNAKDPAIRPLLFGYKIIHLIRSDTVRTALSHWLLDQRDKIGTKAAYTKQEKPDRIIVEKKDINQILKLISKKERSIKENIKRLEGLDVLTVYYEDLVSPQGVLPDDVTKKLCYFLEVEPIQFLRPEFIKNTFAQAEYLMINYAEVIQAINERIST